MNREEAIKEWIMPALKNTWNDKKNAEILKALEQEPCEDCRNCKKWDDCECGRKGHINGTSIGYSIGECKDYEPCEDAVSRQAAINAMATWDWQELYLPIHFKQLLEELQPVTVQEKTGHWILLDECSNSGYYCSECHKKVVKEGWSETVKKIKFCPNCGIKILPQPYKGESEDKE